LTITLRRSAAAVAAVLALTAGTVTGGVAASASPALDPAKAAPGTAAVAVPTGDTNPIHDPDLVKDGKVWYVFSTGLVHREQGGTIRITISRDQGRTWKYAGTVWSQIPAWIDEHYAGRTLPDNLWAPQVVHHGNRWYLYYSASTFGSNDSITALAVNKTLDPSDPDYRWVDKGRVITSQPSTRLSGTKTLQANAIDPGVVTDRAGRSWLTFGSFWNGIYTVPISWPSGKPAKHWQRHSVQLAERPAVQYDPIEGAYVVRHGGWFYLFASIDFCCQGANSTYKIAVGRAREVTGPYRDKTGALMLTGGGTVLLQTNGTHVGAGGQSVAGNTLAYHYYDAANGYAPTLGLKKIRWVNGWPRVKR
jgi:arabinan endo-1,5-alpha-L-arabinosidase